MQREHPPTMTARRAWLASIVLSRPEGFLSRLAARLAGWRALPRRARRRLAATAAGAAIMLAMTAAPLFVPAASAATITVDETTCTLIDAIHSANTNAAVNGCASGAPGSDTIELTTDVTLTVVYGNYLGNTGLPAVTSVITLQGNGHTIARDDTAPEFRVLYVGATGDLRLNDVIISGGNAQGLDSGGGFYVWEGTLAINDSTVSGNSAFAGGGGFNERGTVTITDSEFRENSASRGGGFYMDDDGTGPVVTKTTITGSLFEDNQSYDNGGALYVDTGEMDIVNSTFVGNETDPYSYDRGGVLFTYYPEADVTITGSTLRDNSAGGGGAISIREGMFALVNSTLSGNSATTGNGGGIYNDFGYLYLTNVTVTDNEASGIGGGIYQNGGGSSTTIARSIVSGNVALGGVGNEIARSFGTVTADDYNVFSHDGQTSAGAFNSFAPGASDFDASSDAGNVALAAILNTTLADNGGQTETHNLVDNSPAVDFAPDADCTADPTDDRDQRGYVRPFDVAGQGNEGSDTCDAGAVEFGSAPPPPPTTRVWMSTTAAGTTADGLAFGPHDILQWDGSSWTKYFDGTAAGLTPNGNAKHNINAFALPYPDGSNDVYMSFAQNARAVPGIPGKVDGTDLVVWGGAYFIFALDGSDVGLANLTQEKIDGLHVLPGDASPINGGDCEWGYFLISTAGPGKVPNHAGGTLSFSGEDVLGFCATSLGPNTAGLWHMVLDGSAQGMPRNSTDSISMSEDGQTLYLTTKGAFNVDDAVGGHSMVYAYDMTTHEFSGPVFSAPAEGLPKKVDGLQYDAGSHP